MKVLNDTEVKMILSDESFKEYMEYDCFVLKQEDGLYMVTYNDGMICADDMDIEQLNEFYLNEEVIL